MRVRSIISHTAIFISFLVPLILVLIVTPLDLKFAPVELPESPYVAQRILLEEELSTLAMGSPERHSKIADLNELGELSSKHFYASVKDDLNNKSISFTEIFRYNLWIPIIWILYFLCFNYIRSSRKKNGLEQ